MKKSEVKRFNKLYERHQRYLKLQGKAQKTIDAYSRAIRRARDYFNCCPDNLKVTRKLKPEQFEQYFADLVALYVRIDVASTEKKNLQIDRAIERSHDHRIFTRV